MTAKKQYLLVVSPDQNRLPSLNETSRQLGLPLEIARDGTQGLKAVIAARPELVMLDSQLTDINAASWLGIVRGMKECRDLPVVVMGDKPGPEELAGYFELGADDCLAPRNCDPRELEARLRAVLRRRSGDSGLKQAPVSEGPVTLDLAAHRCLVEGKEVALRPREFELLELLMKKSGRVLSRPYLLEFVWGMASNADTRAVDVTVSRLRRALGPKAGRWLESVAKFGYRFSAPGKISR